MGLEDGDQPRRPQLAQGRERRPHLGRVVARSRRICGPRRASPSAPAGAARPGSRRAPRRRRRRRGRRARSPPARRGRWRGCAARAPRAAARPGRGPRRRSGGPASPPRSARTAGPPPSFAAPGGIGGDRQDDAGGRGGELLEGGVQLGQRAPARVVVHLDVGDHRDLGPQPQEAGVALVGLGDDPLALAPAGVGGARRPAPTPGTSPPTKKAGSAPSARSAQTAIAVVVVLPWVPATAISRFSAQSSASRAPRWIGSTPALAGQRQLRVVVADRGRDDDLGALRAGSRRRGRSPARARPRAAAPYKRTRRGRCR